MMKMMVEVKCKFRTLPKLIFKRKICMILFNILESEDSYGDLESIISSEKILLVAITFDSPISSYSFLSYLSTSHNILRCQFIYLSQHTALPTWINYIVVSVDLICFRIYLSIYLSVVFTVCIFIFFYRLSWPTSISTAICGARGIRIHCQIKYCCCF